MPDTTLLPLARRLEIVRQAPIFAGLSEADARTAAERMRVRRADANQVLFLKSDPGDALFVLVEGRVRMVAQTEEGRQVVLNLIRPLDCFGELSLLDGSPRNATAVAETDCVMLVMSRMDFFDLLRSSPEFSLGVLRMLSARFRLANDMLEAVTLHTLPQRLAQALLALVTHDGIARVQRGHTELTISQSDLALLVGASRVSVNKHLQNWKADGMIELGRSRILVRDTQGLVDLLKGE